MKEGWEYKTLGECCDILNGYPFKSSLYSNSGIRVIRITNVQKGYVIDSNPKYYPESKITEISNFILKNEDILISLTGNVGRVAILQKEFLPAALNQRVACLRIKDMIVNKKFLFFYLNNDLFEKLCIKNSTGAAQLNMSTDWLKKQIIPIPSYNEQRRIVSYLDSSFKLIDEIKNKALKSLTEAKALFQSALAEAMEPKEGWEEKTLPDISDNLDNLRKPVTKNKREKGIYPYYGASGIVDYVSNYLINDKVLLISEDGANLIARSTPIAFSVSGKIWVNNHAHILKFSDMNTQLFVEYYFSSINIEEYVTGAAQPKLTQKNLNKIIIPYPPLPTQKLIVSRLDKLSSKVRAIEEKYQKMVEECDALKQAMLRDVFE